PTRRATRDRTRSTSSLRPKRAAGRAERRTGRALPSRRPLRPGSGFLVAVRLDLLLGPLELRERRGERGPPRAPAVAAPVDAAAERGRVITRRRTRIAPARARPLTAPDAADALLDVRYQAARRWRRRFRGRGGRRCRRSCLRRSWRWSAGPRRDTCRRL